MGDHLLTLSALVLLLVITGSIACLPLYKWDARAFLASPLGVKTWMWVPIYCIVLLSLVGGAIAGSLLSCFIAITALLEYIRQKRSRTTMPPVATMYLSWFLFCILAMPALYWVLPSDYFIPYLAVVYFGSVISVVCAFFLGTYIRHPSLPRWINPHKSWMGVIGQILGGVIGIVGASFIMAVATPWWFGVVIGCASALGDIVNSIAKRQLNIKDWGATIPGHGGMLDRCSSLSVAFLVALIVYLTVLR